MTIKRLCIFCGSASGTRPIYRESAESTGRLLAERGIDLVYGGGNVGLMGAVADACLAAGGRAYGVIPRFLAEKEVAHEGLTELHVVETMHERKALMARLSDGYLSLPGGFGTFDEMCEMLTWSQLRLQTKPCGLLNIAGYYDLLLSMIDHAVGEGFLKPANRSLLLSDDDLPRLLDCMIERNI